MTGISGEWQAVRSEAEQELEQRLSLASSEDMVRGMFFRSVREAVHALAGPEAVEDCLAGCTSGGGFVDFFAYPTRDFLRVLRRAARRMSGAVGGFEGAMRVLGHLGTAAFLESPAGNAAHVVLAGSPRQVLENLPLAYRLMMPAGGTMTVSRDGYTRSRVLLTRDFLPCSYMEGSLEAQLKKAGASGLRVTGRRTGSLSSEYELSWTN
ncbi:TIGR02265 family protein [Archangium sp.]|uniref:TIGR02265 family protein n=1 Tax=Archangium sp. TaxID=1872627 RepID=UPI00389A9658